MGPGRALAVALAAMGAVAPGCGLGPGDPSTGEATLTVTRDYGSERMLEATEREPAGSETVIRFLDREAEITTRYGGGFVESIDGVDGGVADGRSRDWFFFVNGVESSLGAAEVQVRGGDRVWWDYRDWTDALRTPAVIGSWPEPFAQDSAEADERLPVRVECAGERAPCEAVADQLADEGVGASIERYRAGAGDGRTLRLLVGQWARIDADPVAGLLTRAPRESGVFGRFADDPGGERSLLALDERAATAERLGPGSGLVAALRDGEAPPTWVVTGTDASGVAAAADALGGGVEDRYALGVDAGGERIPLPAEAGE